MGRTFFPPQLSSVTASSGGDGVFAPLAPRGQTARRPPTTGATLERASRGSRHPNDSRRRVRELSVVKYLHHV